MMSPEEIKILAQDMRHALARFNELAIEAQSHGLMVNVSQIESHSIGGTHPRPILGVEVLQPIR